MWKLHVGLTIFFITVTLIALGMSLAHNHWMLAGWQALAAVWAAGALLDRYTEWLKRELNRTT